MTRYRIDPAGVQAALTATVGAARQVTDALQPVDGARDSVATGCGSAARVSGALDVLLSAEATRVKTMSARVEACLTGTVTATNAYVRADDDMAHVIERAQAEAVARTRKLAR